ncbi:membrane protein insertion efficiency factor YidD [Spirulina subsalsa]|nr:membrane protein insertion efficiency factor YidD [Spirulina subsalsa]
MKTLSYSRRWRIAIFRGLLVTSKNLVYSGVNSLGVMIDNLAQYRHPLAKATSQTLEQMTRKTGVILIGGYQKYLSPHKGFSCAHRVLYGSESCSQYVKKMLIEQDLQSAISLSRERFGRCKTAKIILRSETLEEKRRREKKNSSGDCGCSPEGCINNLLDECLPDCNDLNCGEADCGDMNCEPDCDCG